MRNNASKARLLDVTRLASRAGKRLTGIDRVERAYLGALLKDDVPAYGLMRTPLGFLLLDETGLRALADRTDGLTEWGAASRFAQIFSKLSAWQQRALTDMRKFSIARSRKNRLGRMLRTVLPDETVYLNVGHSNLTDFVVRGVHELARARIVTFVHDTIPLDFPEFQTTDSAERFATLIKSVSENADLVIYNSAATRADAERHLREFGRCPEGLVAHLGVDLPEAKPEELPEGLPPKTPYFVFVSTIEARKGHNFLLGVWEQLEKQTPPQEMPRLVLVGARGWKNQEFFFRFDKSRLKNEYVYEANNLSDGAVAALLDGATGALFPSRAEGYGLPVFEALGRGVPVICNELPVFREVAKDIPVYASLEDSYLWLRRTKSMATGKVGARSARDLGFEVPSWDAHFNLVLRRV